MLFQILNLGLILVLISVHGFNGLRIILLEMRQGQSYEKGVTYGCIAAMIALVAYGSNTIINAHLGNVQI